MKPAPFAYLAPRHRAQALEALREYGPDAKVLAGGQSLVPLLAMRIVRPAIIVDLNRIRDLAFVRTSPEGLRLGAMTRQRAAEADAKVAARAPLVAEALRHIGHPQIRSRGTVGGSLAHADPAAELPAAAVALDAQLVLASTRGERVVGAGEFFTGYLSTALEPDELLVEIRIPRQEREVRWAFGEVARRHGDFALAGVAVVLRLDGDRRCQDARIVFTGVGPGPVRIPEVEACLRGRRLTDEAVDEAARLAADRLEPPDDIHASAAYRRHVAGVLAARGIRQALERKRVRP